MSTSTPAPTETQNTMISPATVLSAFPTFLSELEALQIDLNTIESKTNPIAVADPNFHSQYYEPQLERTLQAAGAMILEGCAELGITQPGQVFALGIVTDGVNLCWSYQLFLKEALKLFELMEDVDFDQAPLPDSNQSDHLSNSDKTLLDQVVEDMHQTIEAMKTRLKSVDQALPEPNDNNQNQRQLPHNWAQGVRPDLHEAVKEQFVSTTTKSEE
jgi:hypothetical protein